VAHVAGAGEGPVDQDRDHEEADEREDEEDLKVERAGEDHEEGGDDEPGCEYGRSITLLRAGHIASSMQQGLALIRTHYSMSTPSVAVAVTRMGRDDDTQQQQAFYKVLHGGPHC